MTITTPIIDDYNDLLAFAENEVVSHSFVNDVALPSGRVIALLTLDNGLDHKRPNTLGPVTLLELRDTLNQLAQRAAAGEIDAVAVTGKPFILAAGADLSKVSEIPSREIARRLAQLGHETLGRLSELGVPSFVFINGLALGGGLEIGLNADYRTVSSGAAAVALPEVFLGIIPGWGGAYLLPNLIGIENALKVIIENPLKMNRMLKPREVLDLGIADAMFEPADFLERSLAWADGVLGGEIVVRRPHQPGKLERLAKWDIAIGVATKQLQKKIGTVAKSPYRALELLKGAKKSTKAEAFEAENEALADLITGDQFHASMYAFNLVQKRAKRPAGAPPADLAKPVTKVGVLGAGLMASQFALLFLRRLQVPVVITDIDQSRVDKGLAYITGELDKLHEKGRISQDQRNRLGSLISGTVDKADFADADWVIEAVFEELSVKQKVFAEIEKYISPEAVLATNTSSLSVAQIGAELEHPERVVGFHFFNPVAVMPLIEIVRTPLTDDATASTAVVVAGALKKNGVLTADAPGFVVNRILGKLLGEAMHAFDQGTDIEVIDHSLDSLGLPMSPFELLDLVGLKVGAHVLDTMHAAFPDRFFESANLHTLAETGALYVRDANGERKGFDTKALAVLPVGNQPLTADEILTRFQDGLADEINRMLEDGVVAAAEDIDLCMILGAGWPFQMGGATPYLDRVGASGRVLGHAFHEPRIAGVAA